VWVVDTVAGIPGEMGSADGGKQSTLSFPTECCSSPHGVYFIEQGKQHAIRMFNGTSTSTIYRGSPLKNIVSLTFDNDTNSLLVCDRGSNCIWSLNVSTSELSVKISLQDIASVNETSSFCPGAIVKVGQGCFVFSDIASHEIYRYMDSDTAIAAANMCRDLSERSQIESSKLFQAAEQYSICMRETIHSIKAISSVAWNIKNNSLTRNYKSLLEQIYNNLSNQIPSLDTMKYMIMNAPTIVCVSKFFKTIPLSPDTLKFAGDCLSKFMQAYDFTSPYVNTEEELTALSGLFSHCPDAVAGQELLCSVLKDARYHQLK
jgi:hypothetical protein